MLTVTGVRTNDAGLYSVVISNSAGSQTSSVAELQVDLPPTVAIVRPVDQQVFLGPADIPLQIEAADADGTVSSVEVFDGGISLGVMTHAPYSLNWSNVTLGSYTLTAKAIDNDGDARFSAPVTMVVNDSPVIQLSATDYASLESSLVATPDGGVATIKVLWNTGTGAATVHFRTISRTAKSLDEDQLGHYHAVSTNISFVDGEVEKAVEVTLVNNLVYRGNKTLEVELSNVESGWELASPTNAVISLLDDDDPDTAGSFPDLVAPISGQCRHRSFELPWATPPHSP